jgi:hypothetical protein
MLNTLFPKPPGLRMARLMQRQGQPLFAMAQQVIITLEFPAEGTSEEWARIRESLEAQGWRSWSVVASFWCKEWPCQIPKSEIQAAVRQELSLAAIAAKLSLLRATVLSYDAHPQIISVGDEAPTDETEGPGGGMIGPCS